MHWTMCYLRRLRGCAGCEVLCIGTWLGLKSRAVEFKMSREPDRSKGRTDCDADRAGVALDVRWRRERVLSPGDRQTDSVMLWHLCGVVAPGYAKNPLLSWYVPGHRSTRLIRVRHLWPMTRAQAIVHRWQLAYCESIVHVIGSGLGMNLSPCVGVDCDNVARGFVRVITEPCTKDVQVDAIT